MLLYQNPVRKGREYNNRDKMENLLSITDRVLWRRIWQRHAIIGARQIHT